MKMLSLREVLSGFRRLPTYDDSEELGEENTRKELAKFAREQQKKIALLVSFAGLLALVSMVLLITLWTSSGRSGMILATPGSDLVPECRRKTL